MIKLLLLTTLAFLSIFSNAQETIIGKPSIFLDCQTRCFSDILRQEITYLDYKRERQGTQLYVLITAQSASGGGREIQLAFDYDDESIEDKTLKYIRPAYISDLDERNLLIENLKKGLLPLLLKEGWHDKITYDVAHDSSSEVSETQADDPWNYWSFDVSMNLNFNGESSFQEQGFYSRLSASRVTEASKFRFNTWYNNNQSTFTLSDGEKVSSSNTRLGVYTQQVYSIGGHWSLGGRFYAGSSTFGNTDFELNANPALEYNIYPYTDNSTRRFTILYSSGIVFRDYIEPTIFDKTSEARWKHGIDIEFSQTKRWGDISFDIEFDQFFHDLGLLSISFNPEIELNIIKGLRLELGGYIEYVGDRINISKSELSDQDIILQNVQLDTNYSYFTYFGFNYRFGSAINNIVNPRF